MRSRHHRYLCAGAVLWISAARGGAQPAPRVVSDPAQGPAASPATQQASGARPETPVASEGAAAGPASPTAPSAALVLEARLRACRVRNGRSITLDDLRSGDTVMDGDRLQFSVRTSRDAHLYLVFCSTHAKGSRHQGLSVFPDRGSIPMPANETMTVPAAPRAIELDNKPGWEMLYLILSQAELADVDAELANAIDAARQGRDAIGCGAPLRTTVAVPPQKPKPDRKSGPPTRTPPTAGSANSQPKKPGVEIERGAQIVLAAPAQPGAAASPTGTVILPYALKHEPARRSRSRPEPPCGGEWSQLTAAP